MNGNNTPAASAASITRSVLVADDGLNFRDVQIHGGSPTGWQVLAAAGLADSTEIILLQLLPTGELAVIQDGECPNLEVSDKFLVSASDRGYYFSLDGTRFEWPHRHISARVVRQLGNVPDERELAIRRDGAHPAVLNDNDLVDLGMPGIEAFVTQPRIWRLRVQGVLLEYTEPLVKVGDAMKRAGFDPTKAWHIFLIVAGHPKQPVTVDFIVDLRTPGIEKIRLMQRNVDNGEAPPDTLAREFALLDVDVAYLNALGLRWETLIAEKRRWLLIHDYAPIAGYTPACTTLALDIPKEYPAAQIDMFYFAPWILPPRVVEVMALDALPARLPSRKMVLAREDDEDWCVVLACPCGCGQRVELPLIREALPRWKLQVDRHGRPTLSPSVWLKAGCRSHFFVRSGKIVWV